MEKDMRTNPHPIAMFKPAESPYGITYWPANSLAVDLCGIAGTMKLSESQMTYVRKRFRVVEPSGQPLPHPAKRVEVMA